MVDRGIGVRLPGKDEIFVFFAASRPTLSSPSLLSWAQNGSATSEDASDVHLVTTSVCGTTSPLPHTPSWLGPYTRGNFDVVKHWGIILLNLEVQFHYPISSPFGQFELI